LVVPSPTAQTSGTSGTRASGPTGMKPSPSDGRPAMAGPRCTGSAIARSAQIVDPSSRRRHPALHERTSAPVTTSTSDRASVPRTAALASGPKSPSGVSSDVTTQIATDSPSPCPSRCSRVIRASS
jgi:hypothetical protein